MGASNFSSRESTPTNNEPEYINPEKLLPEFAEDALSWGPVSAIQLVIRMLGMTGSAKAPSSRKWKLYQKATLGALEILGGVCRKLEELEGFSKDGKETQAQLKVLELKIGMVLLAMGQQHTPDTPASPPMPKPAPPPTPNPSPIPQNYNRSLSH